MFARDVMTTNLVTIPSTTSLADARRILEAHRIRRLPVVDRGKLVGMVSRDALDRAGPSQLTTFSIYELTYLLSRITVREIMAKDVVTVRPDTTVEAAVALAQERKVGTLLVMEDDRLVGIATTNDFFYKIVNPVLGIGKPGCRIIVHDCHNARDVERVLAVINRLDIELVTLFTVSIPELELQELTLHLKVEDPTGVIAELRQLGFQVEERVR